MPTLIVLRHAKAAAGLGLADIDRPLTDRGRRDATAAGAWLRDGGRLPDRILCSPAQRTRETLECLELGKIEVEYEPSIYDNDVDTLFTVLRECGDEPAVLLLIGHSPSAHELVHDLTGDGPDRFPTCAIAVIDLAEGWDAIRPGAGELTTFRTPKG